MASKRKTRKQRRGAALRLPSGEATTPVKFSWVPTADTKTARSQAKEEAVA